MYQAINNVAPEAYVTRKKAKTLRSDLKWS